MKKLLLFSLLNLTFLPLQPMGVEEQEKLADEAFIPLVQEENEAHASISRAVGGAEVDTSHAIGDEASRRWPLHDAAWRGNAIKVKLLLHKLHITMQWDQIDALDDAQNTPLHYAAMIGNVAVITELLNADADATIADNFNRTPLHIAAANGWVEAIEILCAQGYVDIDTEDLADHTPLQLAIIHGQVEAVDALLQAGAWTTAADERAALRYGQTEIAERLREWRSRWLVRCFFL